MNMDAFEALRDIIAGTIVPALIAGAIVPAIIGAVAVRWIYTSKKRLGGAELGVSLAVLGSTILIAAYHIIEDDHKFITALKIGVIGAVIVLLPCCVMMLLFLRSPSTPPRNKYFDPIAWLGGSALIVFSYGLLWDSIGNDVLPEEARAGVFLQALPFIAVFITIILLFMLLIFLLALRFNGKIPQRTYQPVEWTIITGILGSAFFLFQPWHIVPYEYGFLLLLGSLISFMLWSHLRPENGKQVIEHPPFGTPQYVIAGGIALVFIVIFVLFFANLAKPEEPYGMTLRRWNFLDEAEQTEIADQAEKDYSNVEIPYLVVLSLFPGSVIFFLIREVSGALTQPSTNSSNVSQVQSTT